MTSVAQHMPMEGQPPSVIACATVVNELAGVSNPELVSKRWGHELIYINESYCMKRLTIRAHQKTSMHFHINKHETLLVVQGHLLLKYRNKDAVQQELLIPPGHAFVVPPGFMHQLCAQAEDVILIEASTFDAKEDSVRVEM